MGWVIRPQGPWSGRLGWGLSAKKDKEPAERDSGSCRKQVVAESGRGQVGGPCILPRTPLALYYGG